MEDSVELKACPFCGGQPKLAKTEVSAHTAIYQVFCTDRRCGARTRSDGKLARALAYWNMRDQPNHINEAHQQECQLRYISTERAVAMNFGCTCRVTDISERAVPPQSGGRR